MAFLILIDFHRFITVCFTHQLVNMFVEVLDGLILGEVSVTLHVIIKIDDLPILEVNSVGHHVLLQIVVDHGQLRRCLQLAFKHGNMIPGVTLAELVTFKRAESLV